MQIGKKHGYKTDVNKKGQLFDMQDDSGQRFNLIEKHPEKTRQLRQLLEQIKTQDGSAPHLNK
ncbi:hypothetical protein [Pseudoalteromonas sp. A601]|uniref:hypothetical protein n=1 Tax=Pseudoalteromonas sp. A601 TaxID=1967839 RepID=UPI001C3CE75C|nr:hypothetical protein [Pseudoalteromonas sp. A601]